ncbi:MAG TPA: hypothetical protein V6C76_14735 [Drouetiella sp.]
MTAVEEEEEEAEAPAVSCFAGLAADNKVFLAAKFDSAKAEVADICSNKLEERNRLKNLGCTLIPIRLCGAPNVRDNAEPEYYKRQWTISARLRTDLEFIQRRRIIQEVMSIPNQMVP